jgi:hypothetical protein
MRPSLLIAFLFCSLTFHAQQTKTPENTRSVIIADQYYWAGPEGNLGIEIVGKFQSEEQLFDTLNLQKMIGTFKAKKHPFNSTNWRLRDILVALDLNGNGNVAKWRVSGPKPLLMDYLEGLKQRYEDKSVFYDFGWTFVDFKPTA